MSVNGCCLVQVSMCVVGGWEKLYRNKKKNLTKQPCIAVGIAIYISKHTGLVVVFSHPLRLISFVGGPSYQGWWSEDRGTRFSWSSPSVPTLSLGCNHCRQWSGQKYKEPKVRGLVEPGEWEHSVSW